MTTPKRKRRPHPWDLETHMRCRLAAFPNVAHVRKEVAEFRALKAVARAAKRILHRVGQQTAHQNIARTEECERALARLDNLTRRPTRRTP